MTEEDLVDEGWRLKEKIRLLQSKLQKVQLRLSKIAEKRRGDNKSLRIASYDASVRVSWPVTYVVSNASAEKLKHILGPRFDDFFSTRVHYSRSRQFDKCLQEAKEDEDLASLVPQIEDAVDAIQREHPQFEWKAKLS